MGANLYSRWYWSDWLSDTNLRACSSAARGLWIDMLAIMAGREGLLVRPDGVPIDTPTLARMTGNDAGEVAAWLAELEAHEVFSRVQRSGVIYSRRQRVEAELSAKRARVGGEGGRRTALKNRQNQDLLQQTGQQTSSPSRAIGVQSPESKLLTQLPRGPDSVPRDRAGFDQLRDQLLAAAPEMQGQRGAGGLEDVSPVVRLLQAGYSLDDDVLPAIAAYMGRPRRQTPRAWGFFEPIIREWRDKRPPAAPAVAEAPGRPAGGPWVWISIAGLAMWRDPRELSTVHWQRQLQAASKAGEWPTDQLGPPPGQEGCLVPVHLLEGPAGLPWAHQTGSAH